MYCNILLSILSQSNINASDAISRARTELRNDWKRDLEGKEGKPGGKPQGRSCKNASAYGFSGGKQKGNQGRYNTASQSQPQSFQENFKTKKGPEIRVGRSLKAIVGTAECKGIRQ
jgi:hypothetical protein